MFTFTSRFLHTRVGTVLGWAYSVACMAVMAMCAIIGSEYIQALIPALAGPLNAKLIGTGMVLIFLAISCKGVNATAKVASVFLIFEISVVAGLGLMGIINPQVPDLSVISMYTLEGWDGWSAIGPGVLFGVWMLANFDSAINYIEESRVPVRTVQRSMLLVLTSAFVIYTLAAIGWQYAVPVEKLAAIIEDGNGGPIAAVAKELVELPSSWALDDWPQYMHSIDLDFQMPIQSPQRAVEVFKAEFDAAWEYGALFIPVWHPFLSGRLSRWHEVSKLIEYMMAKGDVWFARMDEIAAHVQRSVSTGAYRPRIDRLPYYQGPVKAHK